jgi:hypothetical protein
MRKKNYEIKIFSIFNKIIKKIKEEAPRIALYHWYRQAGLVIEKLSLKFPLTRSMKVHII